MQYERGMVYEDEQGICRVKDKRGRTVKVLLSKRSVPRLIRGRLEIRDSHCRDLPVGKEILFLITGTRTQIWMLKIDFDQFLRAFRKLYGNEEEPELAYSVRRRPRGLRQRRSTKYG